MSIFNYNIMKNNKLKLAFSQALILFLILASCKKNNDAAPTQPVQINLTLNQTALISSENSYSFDIFNRVLSQAGDGNTIISPLSISYALSMTVNGAANGTRDSILKVLRINDTSMADLNKSYKDLTGSLLSIDSRVTMYIANSVWTEKDFPVKASFTNILTSYYKAQAKSYDITDPTVPTQINSWISNNTNGLINNMISQLDPNTVMLLVNAIYFKGMWKTKFDPSATTTRPFSKPDGSTENVPTMQQSENQKVYRGNGFYVAEIPYGQGNYVMDIMLPDNNDLSAVAGYLTADNLSAWTAALTTTKVNLYMPKFKYGYNISLRNVLSLMGMEIAFTDSADFSNISNISLLISKVLHQAYIQTDEEGTEAAAATVVEFEPTMAGPGEPITIDVDHQFIYLIREVTTNSIIFMGKVTDPLAQ
jgi:serine protease inhibitor